MNFENIFHDDEFTIFLKPFHCLLNKDDIHTSRPNLEKVYSVNCHPEELHKIRVSGRELYLENCWNLGAGCIDTNRKVV